MSWAWVIRQGPRRLVIPIRKVRLAFRVHQAAMNRYIEGLDPFMPSVIVGRRSFSSQPPEDLQVGEIRDGWALIEHTDADDLLAQARRIQGILQHTKDKP